MAGLERALDDLGDTAAEARVRRQFHQLVLALERDGYSFFDRRVFASSGTPAKVLPMPARNRPLAS